MFFAVCWFCNFAIQYYTVIYNRIKLICFRQYFFQEKSRTCAPGTSATGASPAPTNLPATSGNTRVQNPSSAKCATGPLPARTIWPSTWRDIYRKTNDSNLAFFFFRQQSLSLLISKKPNGTFKFIFTIEFDNNITWTFSFLEWTLLSPRIVWILSENINIAACWM